MLARFGFWLLNTLLGRRGYGRVEHFRAIREGKLNDKQIHNELYHSFPVFVVHVKLESGKHVWFDYVTRVIDFRPTFWNGEPERIEHYGLEEDFSPIQIEVTRDVD